MKSQKIYFRNLNSLRFIAALLVIIHHVEQLKNLYQIENYWSVPFVREIGGLGVKLFFVLSGFLITYLLLTEKEETKTVSIKDFYIRRVLRIWPLYYLLVFLGLFVLNQISFLKIPNYSDQVSASFNGKLVLFLLFLPNLASAVFPPVPFISQSWSVGVEEQFYLIWPLLVKRFKNIWLMLLSVVGFYLITELLLFRLSIFYSNKFSQTAYLFWSGFSIDCMAIGGIMAYILFTNKSKILNLVYNTYFQIFLYLFTIYLLIFGKVFPILNSEIYALLFSLIILNLAANPKSILNLEVYPLSYLGKISYGLYMYHSVCIVLSINLCLYLNIYSNLTLYILSLLLSILFSTISYHFFESRFIRYKHKYSKIISGNEALENK